VRVWFGSSVVMLQPGRGAPVAAYNAAGCDIFFSDLNDDAFGAAKILEEQLLKL
jgi:hypothetical protein